MIERKILIGLITNTEFLKEIKSEWNPNYLESPTARLIASWCWEYFNKYEKAPMRNIEGIYIRKLKQGLKKDLAEEIETEILPELSQEFENGDITITYLLDETRAYFTERQIVIHKETIEALLEKGEIERAKKEVENFTIIEGTKYEGFDLSKEEAIPKIETAFDTSYQNVVSFPGALGVFWNDEMRRGAFVALMGMAKRGKTYWLLEFMMRAYKQNRKVAFFQAGDMTENEQIVRICTYLAKKSVRERDCGVLCVPCQDCIKNQMDTCDKKVRECEFGVFEDKEDRREITKQDLIDALNDNPKYKPCYNCVEWQQNKWGSVWLKRTEVKSPLSVREAKRHWRRFFIKAGRSIKMISYANGTLNYSEINRVLDKWDREEGFKPDMILIDYVDIMEAEKEKEHRHKENEKWKNLRRLSQERNALVITPTQTDAQSYKANRLEMTHFTEDRRKYDHVTAMYGLNQDKDGREKEIGIMRVNRIVLREGDFHTSQEVHVLQRLEMGRPFLGSYF